jgi:hypothetical protein
MNKYQEAINYLWNAYDENKIYGIASRGYLETLQELVDKADSFEWIPISEKLPDEHDSIFAKLYGTNEWDDAFWRTQSKEVLVTIEYEDGVRTVKSSHTSDGALEKRAKLNKCKVVAWMPLPEPYKEKENE